MSFFSGRHGSLIYLGKPVARVRNWSLTASVDLLETTKVDQFAPTYRPGMKSATGSASLFYYRLEFRDKTINTSFTQLIDRALRVGALGEALRREVSRGGALFPHLYGVLPLSAVAAVTPLPLGPDGRHVFPADLAD